MSRSNKPAQHSPFSLAPPFEPEGDTGSFQLGQFEEMYESLFAESLESGEISPQERERLNLAAAALGLDAERVQRLESALMAACEARAEITHAAPEDPSTLADRGPPSHAAPPLSDEKITLPPRARQLSESFDDESPTLARPKQPEEVEPNEAQGLQAPQALFAPPLPSIEDVALLRARYEDRERAGDTDGQWRAAGVLVWRGAATYAERELFERYATSSPVRPTKPLTADAWSTHLVHPEEDRIVGEIFGVIASAALIGRVSAMRRDGTLPRHDAEMLQSPTGSTVSAVRALAWSAATLGMRTPHIFLAPELDTGFEIITTVPPASRVGSRMLSGQSALALAFFSGRHLSWYREEHFVCTLVPSVAYLEDIFLAALTLGAPELPLSPDVRVRANIIAEAMHPCLEAPQIERLRRLVAQFLARGGMANLKKWARAAEWTACRTGLLLSGDIALVCEILKAEPRGGERVRQAELFWTSDQATTLRKQLGIALDG